MEREELLEKLRKKDPAERYAAQVYEEHILLTDLLDILETEKTAAKYMAEKIVRYISEDRPQLLYPCFDRLLPSWTAIMHLSAWGSSCPSPICWSWIRRRKENGKIAPDATCVCWIRMILRCSEMSYKAFPGF